MANKSMDEFLGETPQEFLGGLTESGAPVSVEVEPEAPAKPEPAAETTQDTPAPPAEASTVDDEPRDVKGLREALTAERSKRNDYKGERDRLQGEIAAMKAQIEALAKAPPAPPPVAAAVSPPAPPPPTEKPPNPIEDPEGFVAFQQRQQRELMFNERLNMSEAMLRQQHGDDDVDAKIAVFKEAAAANPALQAELRNQVHPYRWAYEHAQRLQAMKEIGPDPKAYEAKMREQIEADIRAKLEAEYANRPMNTPPAAPVNIPTSLGTARSAAPRMGAPVTAPAFEDLWGQHKRRAQ